MATISGTGGTLSYQAWWPATVVPGCASEVAHDLAACAKQGQLLGVCWRKYGC